MKVWIQKGDYTWLEEMQAEGRTREIIISSFRRFKDNREVEVEIKVTK